MLRVTSKLTVKFTNTVSVITTHYEVLSDPKDCYFLLKLIIYGIRRSKDTRQLVYWHIQEQS